MARSQIPVTDIVRSGATPPTATVGDSTNKHYFINGDGRVYLEIVSSDGSSRTVTIKASPTFTADGLVVSDLVITVPAGATRRAGPFKVGTFKQSALNDVFVDPSVSTTLTFRAWRLPAA